MLVFSFARGYTKRLNLDGLPPRQYIFANKPRQPPRLMDPETGADLGFEVARRLVTVASGVDPLFSSDIAPVTASSAIALAAASTTPSIEQELFVDWGQEPVSHLHEKSIANFSHIINFIQARDFSEKLHADKTIYEDLDVEGGGGEETQDDTRDLCVSSPPVS